VKPSEVKASNQRVICHRSERATETAPSLVFSKEDHIAFGQSIKDWPLFPDSSDALAYLSTQFKLVVLSNVDRQSFAYTQSKLEAGKFTFDAVCTAQDIGSYKPDPANFLYALRIIEENYGIEKEQVLSTAWSLHHDHVPAQKLGMSSAWIEREGAVMELGDIQAVKYNFGYKTLGDMAEAVKKELE
jgi:2-haloacid dehalogenase